MSADIVNLRQARKRKAREDDARRAEARRVEFGRSKKQKAADGAEAVAIQKKLESHRLERKT